ncbi:helix-turn-helix transcriptional regulator [Nocardia otitidiscaviarum]|uniref:helix-turn-helix domain-containing protein n=1 Tax=Nocardia otitidiscaviarum TaxID=1823 RepID=UPI0018943E0B|nr:helix-turn-helix domain-containing protein [Nocardia otitidiscaviarum]MBF6138094.1 helix-turn-helix transcriptional regulator [Nocardia otitidiscaviarum]
MSSRVDVAVLRTALDVARQARGLSWRDLAAQAGVSASTLTRLSKGHRPDVDGFAALVQWIGVPAERFMPGNPDQQAPELEVRIGLAVAAEPGLSARDRQFLHEVLAAAIKRVRTREADSDE